MTVAVANEIGIICEYLQACVHTLNTSQQLSKLLKAIGEIHTAWNRQMRPNVVIALGCIEIKLHLIGLFLSLFVSLNGMPSRLPQDRVVGLVDS